MRKGAAAGDAVRMAVVTRMIDNHGLPTVSVRGMKLRGSPAGRYHVFRGDGALLVDAQGAMLEARYDPPNSGWIALGLTAVTFALVYGLVGGGVLSQAAGPGFLPWYLIVRAARRKQIALPLAAENVADAVYDPQHAWLAVQVLPTTVGSVQLDNGWIGMHLSAPNILPSLQALWGRRLRQAPVTRGSSGLIPITLAIVGVLLLGSVLALVATTGFLKYSQAARTVEATNNLMQIGRDAQRAYETEWMSSSVIQAGQVSAVEHKLCPSASLSVPSSFSMVKGRKYQSSPNEWAVDAPQEGGFACLKFSVDTPQSYMYTYESTGSGSSPGNGFTATARGDLKGNGDISTFTLTGQITSSHDLAVSRDILKVYSRE
jgi:hypothetical protein